MDNKYIFFSKNYFFFLLYYFNKKFFPNYFRTFFKNRKNNIFFKDDFFSGREIRFAEHKAHILFKRINHTTGLKLSNFENIFLERIQKKKILESIADLLLLENISRKFYSKYKYKFYIIPKKIDLKIFRQCKKIYKFKFLKISNSTIIFFYFNNFLKSLFFCFKTFFLLEKYIFYKKKTDFKERFNLGLILNHGEKFFKYSSSPIENLRDSLEYFTESNLIENDQCVFIANNRSLINQKKWLNELKTNKSKKNLILLKEVRNNINLKEYFFKIYLKNFKLRFFLLLQIFKNSYFGRQIFETFEDKILWEIFFLKYNLKNSVNVMIPDNSINNHVKLLNNCRTNFVYYSYHGQIVKKKIIDNCTDNLEFAFLDFDVLFSNHTSNEWFRNNSLNNIKKYENIGVITSEIVNFQNKLNDPLIILKNDFNLKNIISIFDHSCGPGGMISILDKKKLLIETLKLSKNYHSDLFLFKSKSKMSSFYQNLEDSEKNQIINSIKNQNNFIILDSDISSYRILSLSDIVITYPQSSIVEESFGSKKKTIIYDISKQFNDKYKWYYNLKDILVDNYTDLSKLIKINMEIDKDEYFKKLKKNEKIMKTFHNFDENLVENLLKKIL